jgi:ABC-2 type transport system ATP-binding protein
MLYSLYMHETTPAIRIEGLKKSFKGRGKGDPMVEALKGVDLEIAPGEFFALLGPNGAGKTTLISILAGLTVKSAGQVSICGVDIVKEPDKARALIGLVPQEFNFNIFETVEDIVLAQAGYYGIPRKEAMPKVEQVLKDLGLYDKRKTQSMKLSGGMKRRLLIARALIHTPKVLLLDEPTAGVDVELRRGMWDFLRTLNASGTAIVLTTHYLEEAEQLCSRVAIITKGEIIEEGSVKGLIKKLSLKKLIIDAKDPVTPAQFALLRDLAIAKTDDTTLELTLKPEETVNDSVRLMTKIGIEIANVRNSGSQLEEVFVNLIDKK